MSMFDADVYGSATKVRAPRKPRELIVSDGNWILLCHPGKPPGQEAHRPTTETRHISAAGRVTVMDVGAVVARCGKYGRALVMEAGRRILPCPDCVKRGEP